MFVFCVFFFKQKTAYEMRISDWSSDVCSSDLADAHFAVWNYATSEWELLESAEKDDDDNDDHTYNGVITGDFDDYLGGANNDEISVILMNDDDQDHLQIA